jgi:hypothetical protein
MADGMFEHVYLVSTKRVEVRLENLQLAKQCPAFKMPKGYLEYIKELGIGELCSYLRVRAPLDVATDTADDLVFLRIAGEWIDDGFYGESPISSSQVNGCAVFATTLDGDLIIWRPELGDTLFELPRHRKQITAIPSGFLGVVNRIKQFTSTCVAYFEPKSQSRSRNVVVLSLEDWPAEANLVGIIEATLGPIDLTTKQEIPRKSTKYFVRAIGGVIGYRREASDEVAGHWSSDFEVRYDAAFDAAVADFVAALQSCTKQ